MDHSLLSPLKILRAHARIHARREESREEVCFLFRSYFRSYFKISLPSCCLLACVALQPPPPHEGMCIWNQPPLFLSISPHPQPAARHVDGKKRVNVFRKKKKNGERERGWEEHGEKEGWWENKDLGGGDLLFPPGVQQPAWFPPSVHPRFKPQLLFFFLQAPAFKSQNMAPSALKKLYFVQV